MKRLAYPVVAAALAGSMLPLTGAAAAGADDGGAAAAYSGYSSTGIATPVKLEIFEPTIPIPTVPQGELDFGYTKIKADSSSTKGRASFLWPGDAVGEGFKTFVEQLGLPPELGANGYPVQVNSKYPGEPAKDEQAPFPGTSMATTSGDKKAQASVGFSSNCDVSDGASDPGEAGGGGGLPGLPGLPELPLPELPTLPLPELPIVGDVLAGVPGLTARESARPHGAARANGAAADGTDADPAATCQIPAALSALVDVGGYVSDTQSAADKAAVTTTSRAALGDVRLIGGLVTLSGITSSTTSTSDGKTGKTNGRADYGTMTIAGQTFAIGPDGFVAAGQSAPIPGLPDDPAAALATLGITITVPQPTYKVTGDKAVGTVEGLIVSIDLKTLSPVLRQLPLGTLLGQVPFPPEASLLKSLLSSVGNLSPKVVVHLGYTTATVDTVQALDLPDTVPDNDPGGEDTAETDETGGAAAGGATGGGAGTGAGVTAPPGGSAPATDAADGTLTDTALSSGLPKLFSIPGMLMALGLGGALLAGSYVRKIGAMVLGGAGSCAHGLDSGLPDLRKVQ